MGDFFGCTLTGGCTPFSPAPYQDPGLPDQTGNPPAPPTSTERHKSACNDGVDNDGDGLLDKQDPDCVGLPGFNPNAPVEPKTDRPSFVDPTLPSEVPFETSPPQPGFNPNLPGPDSTHTQPPPPDGTTTPPPDGTTTPPPESDPSTEQPQTPSTEQGSCNDGVDNENS